MAMRLQREHSLPVVAVRLQQSPSQDREAATATAQVDLLVNEDKLSEVLRDFARTLVTDFSIQGILDHLDHLEWLGVAGVWLNPITPSPNADSASLCAPSTARRISPGSFTIRMPFPPPPAAALMSTG